MGATVSDLQPCGCGSRERVQISNRKLRKNRNKLDTVHKKQNVPMNANITRNETMNAPYVKDNCKEDVNLQTVDTIATHITSIVDHTNNDEFLSNLLSETEADTLQIGDEIDHLRITNSTFFTAKIIDKKDSNLKINYIGYGDVYDEWSNYKTELYRYAKPGSIVNHEFAPILHHAYSLFFRDDFNKEKFELCLKIIKQNISLYFRDQPKPNYTNYLCKLHHRLLQQFINIQLKSSVDNVEKYVDQFNFMYASIVKEMVVDNDVYHLEIDKEIFVDEGWNTDTKTRSISKDNKMVMQNIKLKWQ
eukprot:264270_1